MGKGRQFKNALILPKGEIR